ncbi:M15 family metallopeptidase [Pseudoalteromonas sp. SSDWG2]|uniref:M15 family metallopeptidase n=1 Tax=Pseudoalteromonas sp. SSDWG2 TaxID=3139391 RepID=UPI003BAD712F
MNLALCATGRSEEHLTAFGQLLVHKEVTNDLARMQRHAKADGIALAIASSFRSFERQRMIWNNKFFGLRPVFDGNNERVDLTRLSEQQCIEAIMLYSALPGASRHHFGTDMDVWDTNAVAADYELQLSSDEYGETGPFARLNAWLDEYLNDYGFFRPYREYRGGVAAEPWHISHIEMATMMQKSQNIDAIADAINNAELGGKAHILSHLDALYQRYVDNICNVS